MFCKQKGNLVSCGRQCSSHCNCRAIATVLLDVPHAQADFVGTLHFHEFGPLGLGPIGNFDHLACSLLAVNSSKLILVKIEVRNCTIGGQMGIVDSRDCELLAEIPC